MQEKRILFISESEMKISTSDELRQADRVDTTHHGVHTVRIHSPEDSEGIAVRIHAHEDSEGFVMLDKPLAIPKHIVNKNRFGSMRRSLSEVCHKNFTSSLSENQITVCWVCK